MPAEWASLVFGAAVAGSALVALMIVPPRVERVVLFLVLGGLVASFAGLVALIARTMRVDIAILAALLSVGVFAAAYSVASVFVPLVVRPPRPPSIQETSDSLEGTAVVVSTPAEPPEYDAVSVAGTIEHLDRSGVPLPGATGRPIMFAGEKARYRAAGGHSPSEWCLESITAMVRTRLDEARFGDVCPSSGDRTPQLAGVVSRLASMGYRRIVVAQLSVADSVRTDRARRAVDELRPERVGVEVLHTPPLWGSVPIANMLVDRVEEAAGSTPRDRCGVILTGHGQPPEWQRDHPSAEEHETFFHQRIRMGLLEAGFVDQNVRLAWMDWQEPDITEAARHLAAFDCAKIVILPASMPIDSTATLVDIKQAVRNARLADRIVVEQLPAWGDEKVVADALTASILETLGEELGEAS
jgi:protoheme ferro-lyase